MPDIEEQAGHEQRSEQTDDQANRQADAEAVQLIVADRVKHDGGENRTQVGIDDRRERRS